MNGTLEWQSFFPNFSFTSFTLTGFWFYNGLIYTVTCIQILDFIMEYFNKRALTKYLYILYTIDTHLVFVLWCAYFHCWHFLCYCCCPFFTLIYNTINTFFANTSNFMIIYVVLHFCHVVLILVTQIFNTQTAKKGIRYVTAPV